ncbi:hypothetical protein POL82_03290 [Priestia aryabhattai]|uniref:hypothetical protein n=1 Tax=Priestia aryabhattai TaxID=412384 RepID=UPI00234F2229|nr:hypothetical protein [Priestia aryabhattai]MDC7762491.1 hypothetical protein [Priestia aryabhattai]
MTVLIAVSLVNGVVLTADKMNSGADENGQATGVQASVEKVATIRENIIISTGGVSPLGWNVIQTLKSTLGVEDEMSISKTIEYIGNTMRFAHNLFKKTYPNFENPESFYFVGIYDPKNNKPYLYHLSDQNDFRAELIDTIGVAGPQASSIRDFIIGKFSSLKDINELPKLLASAIRTVNEPTVSKDTVTLLSLYGKEDKKFTCPKVEIDEHGNIIM